MAYDQRFAIGFIGSSGEGGAKLHRRNFGELVENLAGLGRVSLDGRQLPQIRRPAGTRPAGRRPRADRPVRAAARLHQRRQRPWPGRGRRHVQANDAWVDAKGSFLAEVGAGPVYRLLGKKDLGSPSSRRSTRRSSAAISASGSTRAVTPPARPGRPSSASRTATSRSRRPRTCRTDRASSMPGRTSGRARGSADQTAARSS